MIASKQISVFNRQRCWLFYQQWLVWSYFLNSRSNSNNTHYGLQWWLLRIRLIHNNDRVNLMILLLKIRVTTLQALCNSQTLPHQMVDAMQSHSTEHSLIMRLIFSIMNSCLTWHELMIMWCIIWPSSAHNSEQLDLHCSTTDEPPPQSATIGLHTIACELLLISRPAKGRRLSWPEHAVG